MNSVIKNILGIVFLIVLTISGFSQPGQWLRKDSINGPGKFGCIGFSYGGQGYLGTGYDNNDYKRSIYSYDPGTDDWDKMESLGGVNGSGLGRNMAVAFVINGKAYVGTGQGAATFYGDFWEYDILNNTWQIVLGVGMSARRAAVAFSIDTLAYIGTGYDATGLKEDFWKFDPSANTWTQVANYGGTPRQKSVAVTLHGKGFVGLGDDGVLRDDFWKYDPSMNTWVPIPNFAGGARSGACGFVIGSDMFVGTGQDFTSYKQDFWQYNFWNNTWTQIQNFGDALGTPRAFATAFTINGIGYVGAGYDGVAKDDFYSYEAIVGIDEVNSPLLNSTIYPNPLREMASISFQSDIKITDLAVMIYDVNGKLVTDKTEVIEISNSNGFVEIKMVNAGLKTGQYIYSILNRTKAISGGKFLVID